MKRVFVQVVDTRTGGYQFEMIQEPVSDGFEVMNALIHLGISDVDWTMCDIDPEDVWESKFGVITGTTKVVSVIII